MWEYLSRQQKHLHSGHSCGSSIRCDCSATRTPHFLCTSRCPARCHPGPAQSRHFPELQRPCHIPAACTRPGHLSGPRSHHKLSPTVLCNRSQHDLHICAFRSPAGYMELWEREHGHKTVRKISCKGLEGVSILPSSPIVPRRCCPDQY